MNGYELMSMSYKKSLEKKEIDEKTALSAIKVFDFLAKCNEDEKCMLIDSSFANDIIKAYCQEALEEANVDEETATDVIEKFRWIFSEKTAKELLEKFGYV